MVAPKMGSAMLLVSLLALHSGASAQGMCEDNREYKAKTCDAGCPFGFPKCAVDTTTSFTSAVWGPDGSEFSVDPLTDR
ncbi:hypothetical protein T484DRAFT_1780079 [Baffinella frigidus]|nr:hypothetical protein T484DRAFT_1780079 [Cryptophyta sp. CCMP2293]